MANRRYHAQHRVERSDRLQCSRCLSLPVSQGCSARRPECYSRRGREPAASQGDSGLSTGSQGPEPTPRTLGARPGSGMSTPPSINPGWPERTAGQGGDGRRPTKRLSTDRGAPASLQTYPAGGPELLPNLSGFRLPRTRAYHPPMPAGNGTRSPRAANRVVVAKTGTPASPYRP
jgi:hypothetical protein